MPGSPGSPVRTQWSVPHVVRAHSALIVVVLTIGPISAAEPERSGVVSTASAPAQGVSRHSCRARRPPRRCVVLLEETQTAVPIRHADRDDGHEDDCPKKSDHRRCSFFAFDWQANCLSERTMSGPDAAGRQASRRARKGPTWPGMLGGRSRTDIMSALLSLCHHRHRILTTTRTERSRSKYPQWRDCTPVFLTQRR